MVPKVNAARNYSQVNPGNLNENLGIEKFELNFPQAI